MSLSCACVPLQDCETSTSCLFLMPGLLARSSSSLTSITVPPKMPTPRGVPNCRRACLFCRTRKVRCDGSTPCRNCANVDKECYYPPSQRGKRLTARARNSLSDRMARMEAMMQTSSFKQPSQPPEIVGEELTRTATATSTTTTAEDRADMDEMGHPRALQTLEETFTPVSETVAIRSRTPSNHTWNTYPPPPPSSPPPPPVSTYTTRSWTRPATAVHWAYSLNDRSLVDDDTHESTFSTQTQIWEHHGE